MKKGKIVSLVVASALLASTALAVTYRTFTATERPDFNIKMDGKIQTLQDSNGNTIYPVIINGSTYLPLKATAALLGKEVTWDAATSTAIIGEKSEPANDNLFDFSVGTPNLDESTIWNSEVAFEDMLVFTVTDIEGAQILGKLKKQEINFTGDYEKFSFKIFSQDGPTKCILTDMDTGNIIFEQNVEKDETFEVKDFNVKGLKRVMFSFTPLDSEEKAAALLIEPVLN